MIEWMRNKVMGLATAVFRSWAPDLAARLIAEIRPADVASHMKPALRTILAKMEPRWRPAFVKTLRLLAQVVSEIAAEAESFGGGS